jgi:pantothenate kinase type III
LKHTRLVLLSTDGEEIGQRGAIQYVQYHTSNDTVEHIEAAAVRAVLALAAGYIRRVDEQKRAEP